MCNNLHTLEASTYILCSICSLCVCMQDPVDLSLIASRLRSQSYYLYLDIFVADFRRMFTNCK